jgi:hypothetical protein
VTVARLRDTINIAPVVGAGTGTSNAPVSSCAISTENRCPRRTVIVGGVRMINPAQSPDEAVPWSGSENV